MRLRLQRQELLAPTVGLSLQASALTEAHHSQMVLSEAAIWRCGISTDIRAMTVLLAELSSDIGPEAVGRLTTQDSHLPEKSCWLEPVSADSLSADSLSADSLNAHPLNADASNADTLSAEALSAEALNAVEPEGADRTEREANAGNRTLPDLDGFLPFQHQQELQEETAPQLPRLPTRLLHPPLEIHAPIRKNELWVIGERAYVVNDIHFEQRLESVEWWESSRVFRDYFRVWLVQASAPTAHPQWARGASRQKQWGDISGLEALVYRDRDRGKSYLQALFD